MGRDGRSLRARDLQRDPRFALHSGSNDPPDWSGDAKVAGRAEEIVDPELKAAWFRAIGSEISPEESHVFRAELDEVSTVTLNDDRSALVIEVWKPGAGVRRIERA